jgi:NitT/TauT family transport system substrate-binding protein
MILARPAGGFGMGTFVIHSHFRLHEWVAEEKGYYAAEGLVDYVLKKNDLGAGVNDPANITPEGKKFGAYESYEAERDASVSCACHWTVNMAAAADHGTLWGECYSVCPGAIVVPPESPVMRPEDLADVEVAVGYHSGSHYATVQGLEPFIPRDRIKLKFGGIPDERVDAAVDREVAATNVFGLQYYVLEQLGFRKIVDTSFMMTANIAKDADLDDVRRYFQALRRAQADIDFMHQKYVHHYLKELPARYHSLVDVRRFGPGERIVFEPYTRAIYDMTQDWVKERGFFENDKVGHAPYDRAVVSLATA